MCDYSLQGIRNRLAEQGESLDVHRFQTGSKGLTCPVDLQQQKKPETWIAALKQFFSGSPEECAVCIPDGAQLVVNGISSALQYTYGFCATEAVTFRQLSANAGTYRDAVEFKNGVTLLLQTLDVGLTVQVRALSSASADLGKWTFSQA